MTQELHATLSLPFLREEHHMLRDALRRFIEQEVVPHADAWEAQGMVPRNVLRAMGDMGWLGMRYDSEHGGSELDPLATVVLAEELGRSTYGGFAVTVLVHTDMASPHLHHAGNDAQKRAFMPALCSGEKIAAVAMTEADAGSDLASMRTTARADGHDWVLNGSKMFITNGVHADLYFVAAKTGEPGRNHQISMFMVEKGTPGFEVARPLNKTGWLCSDTAELSFNNCRVPGGNLLGEENKGFYALAHNLQNERLVLGHAEVEALRAFIYQTAWALGQGQQQVKAVSMIKALAGTLVNQVMYDCVQFHGGMGFIRETAVERMARDARVQAIGGGATEVMLDEIAKRM
ncbi:MAG: acyl-CoA dehydrogenase [Betaproteobacteria bacterium]|nr:acyl-CoA dehydrogenase [Candidatus Fonsibacter lacus]